MKSPIVKCSACCGKGTIKLDGPLLRTLKVVTDNMNSTIPQIHVIQGEELHKSATNQRVKKLVKLGLVKGKKVDGCRIYARVYHSILFLTFLIQ